MKNLLMASMKKQKKKMTKNYKILAKDLLKYFYKKQLPNIMITSSIIKLFISISNINEL